MPDRNNTTSSAYDQCAHLHNVLPPEIPAAAEWFPCQPVTSANPKAPRAGLHWTEVGNRGTLAQLVQVIRPDEVCGLALGETAPITIIDLDRVLDPRDGHLHTEAEPLVMEALRRGAFVERSASGRGLHILTQRVGLRDVNDKALGICGVCLTKHESDDVERKPAKIEWWSGRDGSPARYVVLTGDCYNFCAEGQPLVSAAGAMTEMLLPYADSSSGRTETIERDVPPSAYASEEEIEDTMHAALTHVGSDVRAMMLNGDATKWSGDRSRAVMACAMSLIGRAKLSGAQCLDVMMHNVFTAAPALDRRDGNEDSARCWMWSYVVDRAEQMIAQENNASFIFSDVAVDIIERTNEVLRDLPDFAGGAAGEDTEVLRPAGAAAADTAVMDLCWVKTEGKMIQRSTLSMMTLGSAIKGTHHTTNSIDLLMRDGHIPCVEALVYDPLLPPRSCAFHRRTGAPVFNTYNGLAIAPWDGADAGTEASVQPWLFWLERIIPDPIQRENTLNFFAAWVQGIRMNQALVLYGAHGGEGKNFLVDAVGSILGDYGFATAGDLFKGFTGWRHRRRLVAFKEGLAPSRLYTREQYATRMKEIIDNATGWYDSELKGSNPTIEPDVLNIVICANDANRIPFDGTDRKYYLVNCTYTHEELTSGASVDDLKARRTQQFIDFGRDWLRQDTDKAGLRKILSFLLARDLKARMFTAGGAVADAEMLEEMRLNAMPEHVRAVMHAWEWLRSQPNIEVITVEQRDQLINAFYRKAMRDSRASVSAGTIAQYWGRIATFKTHLTRDANGYIPLHAAVAGIPSRTDRGGRVDSQGEKLLRGKVSEFGGKVLAKIAELATFDSAF